MHWTPCRTVGGSRSQRSLRSAKLAPTASCSRSPIRDRGFPRKFCPTCASRSSPPGPRAQVSASPSRDATSRKPAAAWTSPVGSVTAPPCVSGCLSPAVMLRRRGAESGMSGSTVLIVDDEQTLARSAKAFLADHGYEAEVAASGEKALELLERLQPDVVFADVRLPGMSGIDLLKRIREFDPVLPVIDR